MTKFPMVLAACVLGMGGAASAQDADDWEYGEDATRGLAAAVSRYDSGHALVVQCRSGELTVAVNGLAFGDSASRTLEVRRADGRRDRLEWRKAGDTAMAANVPARVARLMRGGGVIQFRDGTEPPIRAGFDLPSQSANVDRVLTACGRPLSDERDALPVFMGRADEASMQRAWARDVSTPAVEGQAWAEVSCIVGEGFILQECRADSALPAGSAYGAEMAERLTGVTVVPRDGEDRPGAAFYHAASRLIQVTTEVR